MDPTLLVLAVALMLGRGKSRAPEAPAKRKSSSSDPWMSQASILAIQIALRSRGYDPGKLDGRLGPDTTSAIKAAELSYSMPVTGRPSRALAEALSGGAK